MLCLHSFVFKNKNLSRTAQITRLIAWLRPRNYRSYFSLKLHRAPPSALHEIFSTLVFAVSGPASRTPCMNPPRKPRQAPSPPHGGLSGNPIPVPVPPTLVLASSAGPSVP